MGQQNVFGNPQSLVFYHVRWNLKPVNCRIACYGGANDTRCPTEEVCVGMGVPMGIPWDSHGSGNCIWIKTDNNMEVRTVKACRITKSYPGKSRYTIHCALCLRLLQKGARSHLGLMQWSRIWKWECWENYLTAVTDIAWVQLPVSSDYLCQESGLCATLICRTAKRIQQCPM